MDALQRGWGWFVGLGAVLVVLGIVVIASPIVATMAIELLVGWILVIGGVLQIVQALRARGWRGFLLHLVGGILYLLVGVLLLYDPLGGALALTLVLTAFLVVQGIVQIVIAVQIRPTRNWGWLLASGVITLLLGLLIWSGWPSSALWVIGLLVGIHLVVTGASLIMLGLAARTGDPTRGVPA